MTSQRQAIFLSHGAGPLPLLGDTSHEEMVRCLKQIAAMVGKPAAIAVISAHWEAGRATLTSAANPALLYDYYGFPQESYEIEYPSPGAPALAAHLAGQLAAAGIQADLDGERGFDHGLFVPLKIMYPGADIPCVQLSLLKSLDAAEHIRMGRALQGPDNASLLVIGSGFSFHNMRAFFAPEADGARAMNEGFETWLLDTCCSTEMGEAERTQRLVDWEDAPFARHCHPREEHLLPLHVCYGYAATACVKSFELRILNKKSSMYLWQAGSWPQGQKPASLLTYYQRYANGRSGRIPA